MDAGLARAADVRRQYRRLAALVHPDKCRLAAAAPGDDFKRLRAAADALLCAAVDSGGGGSERSGKRARTEGSGAGTGGLSGGEEEEDEEDSWVADGGGLPWWEEWERPEPRAHDSSTDRAAEGAAGAEQHDQHTLEAMPLEGVRAEVRRRQAALLEPQQDAAGRPIPMQQLQAALRRARTVLAGSATAAAEAAAAAGGGGFLR